MEKIGLQMIDGTPCGISHGKIAFDPLTALADLVDVTKGISNDANIAVAVEKFTHVFNLSFPEDDHAEFFEKLKIMRSVILDVDQPSLETFEKLRSFVSLKFSYEIASLEPPALNRCETGFNRIPPRPGFVEKEELLRADLTKSKNNLYVYTCNSMQDVAFSIMHYLVLNKYKFAECEHCGRLFARKSGKQIYCPRKSPCEGYEQYCCSTAVDKARTEIRRRKDNIRTYLGNYYPDALWRFDQHFDSSGLGKGGKIPADRDTLESLLRTTGHNYIKEHWYRDEYKVKPN